MYNRHVTVDCEYLVCIRVTRLNSSNIQSISGEFKSLILVDNCGVWGLFSIYVVEEIWASCDKERYAGFA